MPGLPPASFFAVALRPPAFAVAPFDAVVPDAASAAPAFASAASAAAPFFATMARPLHTL